MIFKTSRVASICGKQAVCVVANPRHSYGYACGFRSGCFPLQALKNILRDFGLYALRIGLGGKTLKRL